MKTFIIFQMQRPGKLARTGNTQPGSRGTIGFAPQPSNALYRIAGGLPERGIDLRINVAIDKPGIVRRFSPPFDTIYIWKYRETVTGQS
jgi:hypothetical protein